MRNRAEMRPKSLLSPCTRLLATLFYAHSEINLNLHHQMNTKSTIRHYFARVAILLLLHTVTQGAWADDFITDVMVIGGTKAETNALKTQYQSQGWKVNNQDLNEGAGGDYIYLLYKTASDTDPNAIFITGISCFNTPMSAAMFSDGRTYYAAP